MKKTNYHTHHYRCHHATGEIEEYVKISCEKGLEEIGISCHVPYEDQRFQNDRMEYKDIDAYLKEIEDVSKQYPNIKILKSFECEYFEDVHDFYEELAKKTDYLILGQHYIYKNNGQAVDTFCLTETDELYIYRDYVVKALNTGLFQILAHPDIFMNHYGKWDEHCEVISEDIIEACIKNNVLLEYNANGLRNNRNYPDKNFWMYLKKHYKDAPVIVGSDAHNPHYIDDEYVEEAIRNVDELKLNRIECCNFEV